METKDLLDLFTKTANGTLTPEQALDAVRMEPFNRTLDGVNLDLHRRLRTGLGEVVFAQGKSPEQLRQAVSGLSRDGAAVLVTKLAAEQGTFLQKQFPQGVLWEQAGLFACNAPQTIKPDTAVPEGEGAVLLLTAGASDLPVAYEALGTARFLGLDPGLIPDVGVAGLHRIRPYLPRLYAARLLIIIAGMEGALPSVIGGLCGRPVIAVPTSVGYGASFGGLSALLGMLNSCAPGISVVNIDNGFGAAVMASMLLQTT